VSTTIHLSSLLAARRREILERWTRRISREHTDKELSRGELWDHLPQLLTEALAALHDEHDAKHEDVGQDATTASAAHGTQRLRVGFDLLEVIREYEILMDCIFDEIEALGGSVSTRHLRRVQRVLDDGRRGAVSAYIERRDAEIARAHSQHIAFVAHELRSPLMSAHMAVAILRKSGHSEHEWALSLIQRNLAVLRELVDQVLTADQLSAKVQPKPESLDVRELIEQAMAEMRQSAEERHTDLVLEAPLALPYRGDRRLLRSAIGNVLGNAVKFTQQGHAITIRAAQHAERIIIEVEDHCGGLPDSNAAELFEPFVQRGGDRTGFGLGLAIVKQAVLAHGGQVCVRNRPGEGCTFRLELPVSETSRPAP
jgi:signal transduction histidine kinase